MHTLTHIHAYICARTHTFNKHSFGKQKPKVQKSWVTTTGPPLGSEIFEQIRSRILTLNHYAIIYEKTTHRRDNNRMLPGLSWLVDIQVTCINFLRGGVCVFNRFYLMLFLTKAVNPGSCSKSRIPGPSQYKPQLDATPKHGVLIDTQTPCWVPFETWSYFEVRSWNFPSWNNPLLWAIFLTNRPFSILFL